MAIAVEGDVTQPKSIDLNGRATVWMTGIALALFVITLSLNTTPINDLFWQMRAGGNIVATHHVPYSDSFSWTRRGTPWIAHEWGMCVMLWLAYHWGSYLGVWILQSTLMVAMILLLYRLLLREMGHAPLLALFLGIYAALMTSPLISPRPHLWTYLFLVMTVGLVMEYRRNPDRPEKLWWLIPITILWANLHAGVVAGIGLCAIFAFGDALESVIFTPATDPRKTMLLKRAKRLALISLICMVAMIANPYGWRIYEIFGKTLGDPTMPRLVSEWASLDFHGGYGPIVEQMLALFVIGLACTRERRDIAEVLVLLALSASAFSAIRNGPLLGIVGALLIARHIHSSVMGLVTRLQVDPTVQKATMYGPTPPAVMPLLIAISFGILIYVKCETILLFDRRTEISPITRIVITTYDVDSFPEKACKFMEAENFPTNARLYNDYDNGGYFLWRLPQYPIFICTQTDIYFGKVLQDYARLEKLPFGWREILAPYKPDIVFTTTADRQAHLFLDAPEWTLVYADQPINDAKQKDDSSISTALIFVHDVPKYQSLIARCHKDRPLISQ